MEHHYQHLLLKHWDPYINCDREALDILPKTDDIYAAAGDNTLRKGHLYYVYKHNPDNITWNPVHQNAPFQESSQHRK